MNHFLVTHNVIRVWAVCIGIGSIRLGIGIGIAASHFCSLHPLRLSVHWNDSAHVHRKDSMELEILCDIFL